MPDTTLTLDRRVAPLSPLLAEMAAAGTAAVSLAWAGWQTLVDLRLRPDEEALRAAGDALGILLPTAPNTWAGGGAGGGTGGATAGGERACLWLGPDEWLVLAPDGVGGEVERALRGTRPGDPWLSVVDLSSTYTGLVLSGPASRDVLAKACRLDLHERVFGPNACAQTLLAKTRMILRRRGDPSTFDIWVRNSFARYAALWLIDAMGEFTAAG